MNTYIKNPFDDRQITIKEKNDLREYLMDLVRKTFWEELETVTVKRVTKDNKQDVETSIFDGSGGVVLAMFKYV
jgi:hypothetical protein